MKDETNSRNESENKMEVKKNRMKKEDRKYLIIFVIVMIISFLVGAGSGSLIDHLKNKEMLSFINTASIKEFLSVAMPYIFAGINIIVGIVAAVLIKKSKTSMKMWDGENEEVAKKIEGRLGIALAMANVLNLINFFLFAVSVNIDISSKISDGTVGITALINIVIFILSMVEVIVIQKKIIDVNKLFNPEKEGSVLDFKFRTKWINSCDEAEQMITFKAAYTAFKSTQLTCIILWVLCVIVDMEFNIGLMPVIIVTIIWMVLESSYLIANAKLER